MLLPFMLMALGADEPRSADASVTLCNDMKIKLEEVQLSTSGEGIAWHSRKPGDRGFEVGPLLQGACERGSLPFGDYVLSFIEIGDHGEAAMCAKRVTVKPGDTIRIGPDDGAQCIQ